MPFKRRPTLRFDSAINQVNELLAVHTFLSSIPASPVADNILRASLTMLVSALDTYIHELVVNALLFELSKGYSVFHIEKVRISLKCASDESFDDRFAIIESELRRQFSRESFQSSRQIENILSSIGIKKIWGKLSNRMDISPEDIKRKLDLLVRRRNQIVHEGDLDSLHSLQDISRIEIDESYRFIQQVKDAIFYEYYEMITSI